MGLVRSSALQSAVKSAYRVAFQAAAQTRLNADWVTSSLSGDMELRTSLRKMRQRSRDLANNNDYAERFLTLFRNNVLGPKGIGLQAKLTTGKTPAKADTATLDDAANRVIERAWKAWGKKSNCSVSGRLSWHDVQDLALRSLLVDGEVFLQLYRGYPKSDQRFAVQFIDPDQVDHMLNKRPGHATITGANGPIVTDNEIRMGVEIDADQRPLAYYVIQGHPSEVGVKVYKRVLAQDVLHLFFTRRHHQTRGVPFMHTAILRMGMLGKYEEAELVAARVAASKMGIITSKTGDDYVGEEQGDGTVEMNVEPGGFEQLPAGMDLKAWDPQHPNAGFKDFVKAMLRGMASGLNLNYNSLANDLESTNFSSLRAGTLEEREVYKWFQRFLVEHMHDDVFGEWAACAELTGAFDEIPGGIDLEQLAEEHIWRPRGYPWVDPLKDAQASEKLLQNNLTTLEALCAEEGEDWEEILEQRKKEIDKLNSLGLQTTIDPAQSGAAGSDPAGEGSSDEETDGEDKKNGDAGPRK
jgi:lambda family phage portal protein